MENVRTTLTLDYKRKHGLSGPTMLDKMSKRNNVKIGATFHDILYAASFIEISGKDKNIKKFEEKVRNKFKNVQVGLSFDEYWNMKRSWLENS